MLNGWHPGPCSGHADYDIDDLLYIEDIPVARLECFSDNPHIFYCNAVSPDGISHRIGACDDYQTARAWAERIAGLAPEKEGDRR